MPTLEPDDNIAEWVAEQAEQSAQMPDEEPEPPPPEPSPKPRPKDPAKKAKQRLSEMEKAALANLDEIQGTTEPAPIMPPSWQSTLSYMPEGDSTTKPKDICYSIARRHAFMFDSDGQLHWYNKMHWERVSAHFLDALTLRYDAQDKPKHSRQKEAAALLRKHVFEKHIDWRCLAPLEVACKNGVVNVDSCEVRPHRKEDYLETVIPHDYDPTAPHGLWLRVLSDIWQNDKDADSKIAALQEFYGYLLLPHARYKKMLWLQGESNSGKSVIAGVARSLVGHTNTCTLDFEELSDSAERADIVGKLLNLMTEISANAITKEGPLKAITDNEPVSINQKYIARYSYVPCAKHIFVGNNLPHITDQSRGVYNRILLLQCHRIFAEHEQDRALPFKLQSELPGILAWAVEGAARLIAAGGTFTEIGESRKTLDEYRSQNNPVTEFLEQCMERQPDDWEGDPWEASMESVRQDMGKYYPHKRYSATTIGMMLKNQGFSVVRKYDTNFGGPRRFLQGWKMRGNLAL